MGRSLLSAAILAAAACSLAVPAFADEPGVAMPPPGGSAGGPNQNQNQEVTALTGARQTDSYYLPKGIPLSGPFRLFPNLLTEIGYDDNVYKQVDGTKQSSPFLIATPTVILDYDIERLKLDLYGQTSYNEYRQYNLTTWLTGLRGRYEISHDATFEGNISDGLFYESYSSPNTAPTSKRPNEYSVIDASGKVNYKPSRIGVTVGGSYDAYAFTATPINTDVVPPPFPPNTNFLRNAQLAKGWVEGTYDFSPGYSAFVRATYNDDAYSHVIPTIDPTAACDPVNNPCVDRSSHGYSIDGGVTLLLGDLIQGQAFIGYLDQIYHAPFKNISGFDYGANVSWYPTELLTVHLAGARQIENTTVVGASAGDDKNLNLGVDYELLRTLHVLASGGYDDTSYAGASRDDKTITFGGGGKFLMSHYVSLSATYTYTNRSSTVSLGRYVDNLAMLGVNLQD